VDSVGRRWLLVVEMLMMLWKLTAFDFFSTVPPVPTVRSRLEDLVEEDLLGLGADFLIYFAVSMLQILL
jgi:hypothetical protein